MIDLKALLTFKHDSGSGISDYSHKTNNYGRDVVSLDYVAGEYLYIGFRKPINAVYFNHNTSYDDESVMSLEVYNGSVWVSASGFADDTLGLKRSGFMSFDREQEGQVLSSFDGSSLYWYRLSLTDDRAALAVSGVNLVFADDYELMLEQPYITMPEFLGTMSSHILTHSACKNEILQKFRAKDYYKLDSNGDKQNINVWDLLDIAEVKQGAVYLAMSKIYYNMSDSENDIWAIKAGEYFNKYESMINLAATTLDFNDNGANDDQNTSIPSGGTRYMYR